MHQDQGGKELSISRKEASSKDASSIGSGSSTSLSAALAATCAHGAALRHGRLARVRSICSEKMGRRAKDKKETEDWKRTKR